MNGYEDVRANSNFVLGVIGGLIGAIIGAVIWAAFTLITDYQIGVLAIVIGLIVGKCVLIAGKGFDIRFRIAGGALALFGCLLGNLLIIIVILAKIESMQILEVVKLLDMETIVSLFKETMQPMDLLFYGLATFEGFKLSAR